MATEIVLHNDGKVRVYEFEDGKEVAREGVHIRAVGKDRTDAQKKFMEELDFHEQLQGKMKRKKGLWED
jgi:hypothetical protein